ncbi:MAG TPA: hypothetical protein VNE16_00910 [Vicinamibacterales bacterium]|nr:hypothetical protein [Vicinamibacterales bacterium]
MRVDCRDAGRTEGAGAAPGRGGRRLRRAAGVLLVAALAACGKKGPPLPPILYLPAAPAVTAHEQGRTARLTLTVPVANTNGSRSANLERLMVYGYTGEPRLVDLDRFFKRATLVARIPVKPAPPPDADEHEQQAIERRAAKAPGVAQGETIVVAERITPALMTPVPPERPRKRVPVPAAEMAVPLAGPPDTLLARQYYVVGVTSKGRPGPLSTVASVPLVAPPLAPSAPVVTYTEKQISVTWTAPAFVRALVQAPATGTVLPGVSIIGPTYPASQYNVYERPATAPPAPPSPLSTEGDGTVVPGPPPAPLNGAPLAGTAFTDTRMTWGARRCYEVRTVDTYGPLTVESRPSPATCVTLRDTFPPAAPRGLQAVASSGAISLIWEANTETDLAGYLVLRAEAPGGTLEPITPAPIHDTTYRDTTVKPGVRYVYAVVAVDTATPPNRSALSNTVEETAR